MEYSICTKNITKIYKLYKKPSDRLKEAFGLFNKKYHSDFYALNDISINIKKGEKIGIIGYNGSGKSTFLKIVTGVLTPSSGELFVDGKISALLELGAGFNHEMTGIENIYLNGTILGHSKRDTNSIIEDIIQFADIGDFINQPVKTYSSGMFVRLAFATSVMIKPEILIIDEALAVGDVYFQNKCYKKMRELTDKGTTMLFVSHDINSVRQMCDRVMWLEEGMIKMLGDSDEICYSYNNAGLIRRNNNIEIETTSNKHTIVRQENSRYSIPILLNKTHDSIYSNEIEIISVYVKDVKGNITFDLKTQNEYYFHVIAKTMVELKDLITGIILENDKGLEIFNINTFMKDSKTYSVKKDEYSEVIFKVNLPKLKEGEYLVTTAIANGTQQNSVSKTWINSALKINITNIGYNWSVLEPLYETEIKKYEEEEIEMETL